MIIAVTGSGGKTTLIHQMADKYRREGKKVFVTTSTHMLIEEDTLLTDDAAQIIRMLESDGYVMAGVQEGEKITSLPLPVYEEVCRHADIVLVEADGSKNMPLKYPIETEPVIYDNVDEIIVVCGLHAIGKPLRETAFRLEKAKECLEIDEKTRVTPEHIQKLVRRGYLERMKTFYDDKRISIHPTHDGTLYQRAIAGLIKADLDVNLINEEWFEKKPCLFVCGGGHVAKELIKMASMLDFRIRVMDNREEFANEERFPEAEEVICDEFENLHNYLEGDSFYVVVTRGHRDDYICVKQILRTSYRYLGMIGSRIKVAKTVDMLGEDLDREGLDRSRLDTIHAPIGLPIGAANPGEIAVSILAEIIEVKNKKSTSSISSALRDTDAHGTLCIIVDKTGSSPRSIGSMMLVGDEVIDSIGGGAMEAAVIEEARSIECAKMCQYDLSDRESANIGMICGGSNTILYIPV
ncbi:MAG: putative selenium-dependent hydroxylase accessory protein YqeC [Clostridiales bacterium]|nr:putative selenium-dependent hydroxylase accessory protein YqeC [Candidatus Crickella merdequi]